MEVNPYAPPATVEEAQGARPTVILPFSVGASLGQTFSLYFKNFPVIAGVTLTVFAPIELIKGYVLHASGAGSNTLSDFRGEMILDSVFGSLVSAALIPAIAHNINTGRSLGPGAALSAGFRRWGIVFVTRLSSGFRIGLGFILLIIPGVIMGVRYSLTDEVAVLEPAPRVRRVLERSEELVRGHGWGILLVALVGYAVLLAVAFVGGILSGLTTSWVMSSAADCLNDLAQRILSVMFVVVYFGLARGPADTSPALPAA